MYNMDDLGIKETLQDVEAISEVAKSFKDLDTNTLIATIAIVAILVTANYLKGKKK